MITEWSFLHELFLSLFVYVLVALQKSPRFQEFQVWNSGSRSWVVTESDNQGLECWQGWFILFSSTVWSGKKFPICCYQHVSQLMSGIIAAIIQYHTERHSTHTVCWIHYTRAHFTLTHVQYFLSVLTQWCLLWFSSQGCHNKCKIPS